MNEALPGKITLAILIGLFSFGYGLGQSVRAAVEPGEGVPIAINELMASNGTTASDPQGQFDDWIELHNYGDLPLDVGGMYLTDDLTQPTKWRIPTDDSVLTTIPPSGYLLIWADGDAEDPGLHASFKLDAAGEDIGLFAADGTTLIDAASFPAMTTDVSYGRCPDAGDEWCFFATATPGAANQDAYDGVVAEIELSQGHGFYNEPFLVTLATETPGVTIYYSLDGEIPGRKKGRFLSGQVYTDPISIGRTTCLRAMAIKEGWKASAIRTQTYIFVDDVIRQSAVPNPGWPAAGGVGGGGFGGFPGFSGGSQYMDYGMDAEVVNDPRYIDLMDDALLSIPSISLVTELANLFDSGTGVYVNALQDGRAWERPVSVELIYPDGTEGFTVDAGLRIRGGYGRLGNNAKHGFRLFFRSEYGPPELRYPLFDEEGVDTFEKVDLRTAQNYSWAYKGEGGLDNGGKNTLLREVFSRDLQGATGQPYTRSRYYHLYLNGQYWGIYQTQERSEARYAESYFGGSREDYDVVKVDAGPGSPYTMHTTDGTLDAYNRLWQAARAGFATDEAYCRVQGLNPDGSRNPDYERLLDVDNLIDYMLCTFYVGDLDAPISNFLSNTRPNNFYAIYNRVTPDGFKFFRHDSEHTLFELHENRTGPYDTGRQAQYFNPQWLQQQLFAHPEFRMRFADHVYEHFFNDGTMTPEASINRLLDRKDTIDMAIIAESARWGDAQVSRPRTKDDDWLPQVEYLINDYFPYRTGIALEQLRSKGWYPSVDAPTLNQHGGRVEAGFGLTMTAAGGDIYYTLDGTDPRLSGGAISTHATRYTGAVTLTESARIKARTWNTGAWSAVHQTVFAVGPVAESLRISEIMYHPLDTGNPDDPNTEYIELTNIGAETINLSLVQFRDGIDFTFPSVELAPGDYCLVVKDFAAFESRYGPGLPIAGEYVGSLANGGERIVLVDALAGPIQSFEYQDDWYEQTDGLGFSLTMRDPTHPDLVAWSQETEWRPSTQMGGSPGTADAGTN